MPQDNRYTIAFNPAAELAVKAVMDTTNYKSVPDIVRAATSVLIDLLDVSPAVLASCSAMMPVAWSGHTLLIALVVQSL